MSQLPPDTGMIPYVQIQSRRDEARAYLRELASTGKITDVSDIEAEALRMQLTGEAEHGTPITEEQRKRDAAARVARQRVRRRSKR